jgi:hypothetical protein
VAAQQSNGDQISGLLTRLALHIDESVGIPYSPLICEECFRVIKTVVVVFDLTSLGPTEWLQLALELRIQLRDNTGGVKRSKPIT